MSNITPGEWVYEENAVRATGIPRAAGSRAARPLVADVFGYGGLDEKAANIKAICAVPKMIEALRVIIEKAEAGTYDEDIPGISEAARNALKEAGQE